MLYWKYNRDVTGRIFYLHLIWLLYFFHQTVALADPPRMMEHIDRTIHVPTGQSVFRLLCPVQLNDDFQQVIIDWKKNGEQIDSDNRIKIGKDNRELKFKNIRAEDSGRYTCQATNGFGHVSINFTVLVNDHKDNIVRQNGMDSSRTFPLDFRSYLTEGDYLIFAKNSSRLEMKCPDYGYRNHLVQWYKNNLILNVGSFKSKYTIESVTPLDSAVYRCVVEDEFDPVQNLFHVHVSNTGKIDLSMGENPEIFFNHKSDISVDTGHTAQISCKINAKNIASIKWMKERNVFEQQLSLTVNESSDSAHFTLLEKLDDDLIQSTSSDPLEKTMSNRLIIPTVSKAQGGRYFCVATTTNGKSYYQASYLTVIPKMDLKMGTYAETLLFCILFASAIFLSLVVYAIVFLRKAGKEQNTHSLKPPPPPCIPPPKTPTNFSENEYDLKELDYPIGNNSMKLYSSLHYIINVII
ncbi:unnamed protein product [Auanema sp. JU1783]|nr:unnamed protein product [Auanema sp. JU1783]